MYKKSVALDPPKVLRTVAIESKKMIAEIMRKKTIRQEINEMLF